MATFRCDGHARPDASPERLNVDQDWLIQTFCELVRIDSPSLREGRMAERCRSELEALGFRVRIDSAGARLGGQTGNLIATLDGDPGRPPLLLTAHLDTIAAAEGVEPVVDEHGIVYSRGRSIPLGADDKAGVAAILAALRALVQSGGRHGTIQVVFTVAEELGLLGARQIDREHLCARFGLALDGEGDVGTLTVAGPAGAQWRLRVTTGSTEDAARHTETGLSAVQMVTQALSLHARVPDMPDVQVRVRGFRGVCSDNGSPPGAVVEGEAVGSGDPHRLQRVLQGMEKTLVETVHRLGGHAEFESDVIFAGFHFPPDHPARVQTEAAIRAAGFQPRPVRADGGSDANVLTSLGIPTVNIGIGLRHIHTPSEHIPVADLTGAARVALAFCKGLDVTG